MGIPLSLQSVEQAHLDSGARGRLARGQVVVEQMGPHAARVYRQLSDKEPLLLTGEVQQITEQLARATIYLLIDELVRFPVDEQPARLQALRMTRVLVSTCTCWRWIRLTWMTISAAASMKATR